MKIQTHNPNYKLVSIKKTITNKSLELVYGITNEGENEGLEIYFLDDAGNFYRSYRYLSDKIPQKYIVYFNHLKEMIKEVPKGHRMIIN